MTKIGPIFAQKCGSKIKLLKKVNNNIFFPNHYSLKKIIFRKIKSISDLNLNLTIFVTLACLHFKQIQNFL